ncbi:MAG: hypothetical protein Q9225_006040 [Loekoesia sp. 1 TL-2023]
MPFELDDVRQDENDHFEDQIFSEHMDDTKLKLVQEPFRCLMKQNGKLVDIVGWLHSDKILGTVLTFSTRFVDELIQDTQLFLMGLIGDPEFFSTMHTEAILSKFRGALVEGDNDGEMTAVMNIFEDKIATLESYKNETTTPSNLHYSIDETIKTLEKTKTDFEKGIRELRASLDVVSVPFAPTIHQISTLRMVQALPIQNPSAE